MSESLEEISKELDGTIEQLASETRQRFEENEEMLRKVTDEIAAMEKTDVSENAPLQIKRDQQSTYSALSVLLGKRLKSISSEIGSYRPNGFIQLGTTVEVSLLSVPEGCQVSVGTPFIFKLVQHDTSDATKRLVAIDCKLGAALLSRTAGDIVEIETYSGRIKYKVERIY